MSLPTRFTLPDGTRVRTGSKHRYVCFEGTRVAYRTDDDSRAVDWLRRHASHSDQLVLVDRLANRYKTHVSGPTWLPLPERRRQESY